jgi:hemerythrin-like domain-containing protein
MKSIEILEREHRWVGWMANCLERLVAEARARDQLDELASELLFLYESFADGRHQDKEEQVLFPELLTCADDETRGLLDQLMRDHSVERRHMAKMRLNVAGAVHGEPLCVREFTLEATEYMGLHRAHMQRETENLLPLAEQLLTPEADGRVVAGFEEIEGGSGDPHGLEEQITGLCRRAGLPLRPAA